MLKIIKVHTKLGADERETTLNYDSVDKMWILDSTVYKHYNKALKQGWTPIRQYIYDDGTVCGMVLTAPERAITIRSTVKKQMSEDQLTNLSKGKK